ncbi:LysM peptidoglycan-binding domain-containing protein [Francisellaceae bacterium]|nr:LysM peptidoglycan-binding domain-containing protein [Francisellaceae bacterium]
MRTQKIIKPFLFVSILLVSFSSFALTGYTVRSGDSLWRIAINHKQSGVTTSNMVKAIQGLNVESHPNIINDVVAKGQTLTLPTSSSEVKKALTLLKEAQNAHLNTVETQPEETVKIEEVTPSIINKGTQEQSIEKLKAKNSTLQQQYEIQKSDFNISVEKSIEKTQVLEKEVTQEKENSHLGWGIAILFFIVLLYIWRKRRKNAQNPSAQLAKKRASGSGPSNHIEPNFSPYQDNEAPSMNVNEALVEAMILLEEGSILDAKNCLQVTLDNYPENIDVRIKLLEVYGAENDEISFNSERDYLSAHLLAHDDPRWEEIDQIHRHSFFS